MARRFRTRLWLVGVGLLAVATLGSPAIVGAAVKDDSGLYVAKPVDGARQQVAELRSDGNQLDADRIEAMIETPQAEWFTGGSAHEVQQAVKAVVQRAQHDIPVLVAYNIPFRDCSQFSAGGATSVAEYEAWIDGFAAGIDDHDAIVILEPDGLGIIPWYNPFADRDTWVTNPNLEWCQPAEADSATAAADRFAMLRYAVDKLKANPNAKVYLDGTHSSWLGAGDAADRLIQAGVTDTDGFFLNVSNYRRDAHLIKYGTWISKCIAFASNPASWGLGHTEWCASQYSPASPDDFSTWGLSDQWYVDNVESQTWWYSESLLKHFVIDTSRNGQGPWTPPAGVYPDAQDWCNPPGRGVGVRPTLDTGVPLVDAYLWVKIPGASDGECTRGLGPAGTTVDPEWDVIDPPAGAWFPEMALDLVRNAEPDF
jgi:endoglucanase